MNDFLIITTERGQTASVEQLKELVPAVVASFDSTMIRHGFSPTNGEWRELFEKCVLEAFMKINDLGGADVQTAGVDNLPAKLS